MKKRVLVLSTSLRPHSNSHLLAQKFAQGAQEAGHAVELISLQGKDIHFCQGCLACLKTHRCVIQDDANAIVERMAEADVICFATPVYYYEMAGQMKTLLDRANSLYTSDYNFRDIYLLTASAEEEDSASDGPIHGLNGWIACFEKARLASVIRGGGASAPTTISADKQAEAYQLGKQL